eukprot:COSAG01_NODE_1649_length_9627_cov_43.584383_6_plen_153_part_00
MAASKSFGITRARKQFVDALLLASKTSLSMSLAAARSLATLLMVGPNLQVGLPFHGGEAVPAVRRCRRCLARCHLVQVHMLAQRHAMDPHLLHVGKNYKRRLRASQGEYSPSRQRTSICHTERKRCSYKYIVHVKYMDYVYGASRVLTVFIL